jgi:hypothetical protein
LSISEDSLAVVDLHFTDTVSLPEQYHRDMPVELTEKLDIRYRFTGADSQRASGIVDRFPGEECAEAVGDIRRHLFQESVIPVIPPPADYIVSSSAGMSFESFCRSSRNCFRNMIPW